MRLSRNAATPGAGAGRARRVLFTVTDPVTALGFMRGQLSYLRAQGYDVHLASHASAELRAFAAEEGATLHDVPLSRTWLAQEDLTSLRQAVRVLRAVRPDLLVYSTPKASLVWALAALVRRPPAVIYLMRGLRLESERRRGPAMGLLWLCELVAACCADLTVCVSHGLRERALALRLVRAERAVVLGNGSSNGVDATRFHHDPARRADMRQSLGYTDDDVVVGFVGRLTEDKGVPELLEAVDHCEADVRLLLVGPAERGVDEASLLEGRADRLQHVQVTRHVAAYYDAMDLLVLPSWGEGLPNVLLEAQAMGLPCITTTATGCRDAVVPNDSALVVKPRAPRELARVIDRLARHPEQRARMGSAGREHVLAHFDPAQQWARYVELFDAVLARRRAAGQRRRPAPASAPTTGPATDPAPTPAPRIPEQRSAEPSADMHGADNHSAKNHSAKNHSAKNHSTDNEREVV